MSTASTTVEAVDLGDLTEELRVSLLIEVPECEGAEETVVRSEDVLGGDAIDLSSRTVVLRTVRAAPNGVTSLFSRTESCLTPELSTGFF
jgi:hypothetical protein